jgi:phage-related holin
LRKKVFLSPRTPLSFQKTFYCRFNFCLAKIKTAISFFGGQREIRYLVLKVLAIARDTVSCVIEAAVARDTISCVGEATVARDTIFCVIEAAVVRDTVFWVGGGAVAYCCSVLVT